MDYDFAINLCPSCLRWNYPLTGMAQVQGSEQARNVLGDHMQASSAAVGVVEARYGSRFAALESFVARRAIRNLNGHRADGKLRIRFGRLPCRSGSFRRRCNGLCLRWQSTDDERCTRNGSTVLINSYDDQGKPKRKSWRVVRN
jgi:hypothetical protein